MSKFQLPVCLCVLVKLETNTFYHFLLKHKWFTSWSTWKHPQNKLKQPLICHQFLRMTKRHLNELICFSKVCHCCIFDWATNCTCSLFHIYFGSSKFSWVNSVVQFTCYPSLLFTFFSINLLYSVSAMYIFLWIKNMFFYHFKRRCLSSWVSSLLMVDFLLIWSVIITLTYTFMTNKHLLIVNSHHC